MTPDEKRPDEGSGEPKFRERRSAFTDDDETRAPSPADPGEVRVGGADRPAEAAPDDGEPVIEAPPGARPARPAAGAAPEPGPDAAPAPGAAPEPGPGAPSDEEIDLDRLDRMEIPEPSFLEILQPLEIQALQFLGVAPLTESGEKRVLPRWAKHVIDLLGLLEERTRGNLPEEEKAYLDRVLTELRTRYLRVTS